MRRAIELTSLPLSALRTPSLTCARTTRLETTVRVSAIDVIRESRVGFIARYRPQTTGVSSRLLPDNVDHVLLVLAHELAELIVDDEIFGNRHVPGSRVELWIVDRHLYVHMAEIAAPESLRQAHLIGMWMPSVIEPRDRVQAVGFHYERAALPSTD